MRVDNKNHAKFCVTNNRTKKMRNLKLSVLRGLDKNNQKRQMFPEEIQTDKIVTTMMTSKLT